MGELMEIYPSLISSNLLNIQETLTQLDPYCHGYHLDVMDDHFVPNLTWGADFINAIIAATTKPIHVHLMVQDPTRWIKRLNLRSTDIFIFHYESFSQPHDCQKLLDQLITNNIHAGMAINPATPIATITDFLPLLKQVLVMSVNPGFSGQTFIQETTEKIQPLASLRKVHDLPFQICMDGGINHDNLRSLVELGVDQVAVASAIFAHQDPVASIQKLYQICT